jgi:phage tail protein X
MAKKYLVPQGTVWDQISYLQYGDERFISDLLRANPALRRIVRFEAPTLITIPDKPVVPPNSVTQLPPWKQGA